MVAVKVAMAEAAGRNTQIAREIQKKSTSQTVVRFPSSKKFPEESTARRFASSAKPFSSTRAGNPEHSRVAQISPFQFPPQIEFDTSKKGLPK